MEGAGVFGGRVTRRGSLRLAVMLEMNFCRSVPWLARRVKP